MAVSNVTELIDKALEKERFKELFRNQLSQFVDYHTNTALLGAFLLPIVDKTANQYDEFDIQFETIIADDSNRYDPAVKKKRSKERSISVSMGHMNIGIQFAAWEIEKIQELLDTVGEQDAENYLLELMDKLVRFAIDQLREKHRWEAILTAQQKLVSADGRKFTLPMENPAGHRVTVGGTWSDPTYNPVVEDLIPMITLLRQKGFIVTNIIGRENPWRILAGNEQIMKATKLDVNQPDGGQVRTPRLRQYLIDNTFDSIDPQFSVYEGFYKTQAKTNPIKYYIPEDALVLVCRTGRDYTVAVENGEDLNIPDTLGYFARGKVMNEKTPGDFVQVIPSGRKPEYVEAEAYAAGAAVIQEPEAIAVLSGIA